MKNLNPDFYLNVGDLFYAATNKSTYEDFLFAYHEQFKSLSQRNLHESVPLVYTFDDHDFGSNNADGTSKSADAAN
jgi:phosphodiesterase/alkaline phosphatase D-like protein